MAFQPRLRDLQWLNAYSRGLNPNGHLAALYRLLEMRGGVESLTLPGFAASMNYLDILRSTHTLCQPFFLLSKLLHDLSKGCPREDYFGHVDGFEGRHFADLDESQSNMISRLRLNGLPEDIVEFLRDLQVWVKVLEAYTDGTIPVPKLGLLAANRNLIQYRLLSTISADENIDTESVSHMHQLEDKEGPNIDRLVQLGLLIFSIGVTFPLMNPRLYRTLASRLKAQMEHDLSELCNLGMRSIAIWLCMLGCLAAMQVQDSEMRSWFLEAVCQVEQSHVLEKSFASTSLANGTNFNDSELTRVQSWQHMREVRPRSLLWYDEACESMAKTVWEEVQRRVQL